MHTFKCGNQNLLIPMTVHSVEIILFSHIVNVCICFVKVQKSVWTPKKIKENCYLRLCGNNVLYCIYWWKRNILLKYSYGLHVWQKFVNVLSFMTNNTVRYQNLLYSHRSDTLRSSRITLRHVKLCFLSSTKSCVAEMKLCCNSSCAPVFVMKKPLFTRSHPVLRTPG